MPRTIPLAARRGAAAKSRWRHSRTVITITGTLVLAGLLLLSPASPASAAGTSPARTAVSATTTTGTVGHAAPQPARTAVSATATTGTGRRAVPQSNQWQAWSFYPSYESCDYEGNAFLGIIWWDYWCWDASQGLSLDWVLFVKYY